MGFSEKQIGRMTYRKFDRLYEMYKNIFDLENQFAVTGRGYSSLMPKGIDDVIPL